jgi:hypothetical protein
MVVSGVGLHSRRRVRRDESAASPGASDAAPSGPMLRALPHRAAAAVVAAAAAAGPSPSSAVTAPQWAPIQARGDVATKAGDGRGTGKGEVSMAG